MRKLLIAAAAAVLALLGCQKNPEAPVSSLTFTSKRPTIETRTGWTGKTIEWTAGDAISMAYTVDGKWVGPNLYPSASLAEGGPTAHFSVPGNFSSSATGVHRFYAVYPAVSYTDFSDAPDVHSSIPEIQTPTAASYDPAADLMAGQSDQDYRSLPSSPVPLKWKRLTAHADITLKNLGLESGETVQSIVLQAQHGAELTGDVIIDLANPAEFTTDGAPRVTVKSDNLSVGTGGDLRFWVSVFPVTLTELTVTVTTDKATYRKVFSNISKTFSQNARNVLGISMQGAEMTPLAPAGEYYVKVTSAPVDWTGDYLIVYEDGAVAFNGGLSTLDASGNTISVTIENGKIEATEVTRAAQFKVSGSGGAYSVLSASGLYIGRNADNNGLNSGNIPFENTLSMNGSDVDIMGSEGAHLRYNKANDQLRFRYFKSSTYTAQQAIQLYKLEGSGDPSSFNAVVTTLDASRISSSQATLNARFNGVSTLAAPQDVGFYVGTSPNNMEFVGNVAVSGTSGTYSVQLSELTPNQKYFFYATMSVWNPETNRYQTITGETKEFTTSSSGTVTADLDWAELPALNYTHHISGGDYFIDNNHYSLYQDGSLYVAHQETGTIAATIPLAGAANTSVLFG